jgi:hypothetical protein
MRIDAVEVHRTLELIKEVQRLNALLGDFTISAGRFIITRDERTLAGRKGTLQAIDDSLTHLRPRTDQPHKAISMDT